MNSRHNNLKSENRNRHAIGFSNGHPPGGLVAWPDGTTSRTGSLHTISPAENNHVERKGFVAWPEKTEERLRA